MPSETRPASPGSNDATSAVLIVFVDGVGLARECRRQPVRFAPLPALASLAGGPLIAGCARTEPGRIVREVDATLGVDGLPQSGTGQTALFTGVNAAQALGRHVPAFPGPRLKAIIEARGAAGEGRASPGRRVTFANAFTPSYLRDLAAGTQARVGDGSRRDLCRPHAAHRGRPAPQRGRHLGLSARLLPAGGGRARARDRRGRGRRASGGARGAPRPHSLRDLHHRSRRTRPDSDRRRRRGGAARSLLVRCARRDRSRTPGGERPSRSSSAATTATSRSRSTVDTPAIRCR